MPNAKAWISVRTAKLRTRADRVWGWRRQGGCRRFVRGSRMVRRAVFPAKCCRNIELECPFTTQSGRPASTQAWRAHESGDSARLEAQGKPVRPLRRFPCDHRHLAVSPCWLLCCSLLLPRVQPRRRPNCGIRTMSRLATCARRSSTHFSRMLKSARMAV